MTEERRKLVEAVKDLDTQWYILKMDLAENERLQEDADSALRAYDAEHPEEVVE